MTQTVRAT